jgi:beta-1,4-mannosyl-glycoprotein beta-1,4-N-acetylglucosaminyltransferase
VIVDCFTFFNELDILELRLSVLGDVVDRFVLCESPFTFRGAPKPLFYAENKERFARWSDRIVHLVYAAAPQSNPWHNESAQRAHLTSALADVAPDDLVLIGDVDEIPAPDLAALRPGAGRVLAHRHVLAVGYVNRVVSRRWIGTKAIVRGALGDRTLHDIRTLPLGAFDVVDSGWHLSAIGGAGVMAEKIRAYSHVEADVPYLTDKLRLGIQFESEAGAEWVPLEGEFPDLLRDPKWSAYVWRRPKYEAQEAVDLMHAHGCFAALPPDPAKVAALTRTALPIWQQVGTERYGGGFQGAFDALPELLPALPRDGWAVVGDLGCWDPADLAALAARAVNVVAYAPNARSFAVVKAALEGARFPAGPARGLPELEADIAGAGFRIENRDDLMDSIFAPAVFEQREPFDVVVAPFRFDGTTRAAMHHFSVYAYVFRLRPVDVEREPQAT